MRVLLLDAEGAAGAKYRGEFEERLKASADEGELAWKLILERHIFDLEAELNWLDHIESGAVSEAARRAAFAAAKGRSMNWAQAEAGISERAGVR